MTKSKAAQLIVEKAIQNLKTSNNASISMLNYGMNADDRFMLKLKDEMPPWMSVNKESFGYLCFRSLPTVRS